MGKQGPAQFRFVPAGWIEYADPSEEITILAAVDVPPWSNSAMDGYAVRAADVAKTPCRLDLIGESAAGHGFTGRIGKGEAVRIFTGAPVPEGADTIVIQENVRLIDKTSIHVEKGEQQGRFVRPAGLDFSAGDVLLNAQTTLDASKISLAAAMNHPRLPVVRKPRVSIIATGDELVMPGTTPGPDQIVASNNFGVSALVQQVGADATDLGIAADTLESLEEKFNQSGCADSDIVVTLGGASVGDHDLVRTALEARGVKLDFWKLAMRPGKPVMFGKSTKKGQTTRFIGLPGNPVSSLVCTVIFLWPLMRKMQGLMCKNERHMSKLATPLPANDQREEYMRAHFEWRDGVRHVTPFDNQDSSILTLMTKANCLLVRPAHAPAAEIGAEFEIIEL